MILTLLLWSLIFIVSLTVLLKASDYFVEASEKIGIYANVPKFVIGATIIALGTSLPELASSIVSVIENSSEIVVGNVLGSNVANIFLVFGISVFFFKVPQLYDKKRFIDLIILQVITLLFGLSILDQDFAYYECIIFIVLFIAYLVYVLKFRDSLIDIEDLIEEEKTHKISWKEPVILIISVIFIYLGAKYTVEAVIQLSNILNIGKEIIAITAVALGTSLPELFVSYVAGKKGNFEMVIGNVIGSNIFNTLAIMGIPSLFGKLIIPTNIIDYPLPILVIASVLLFLALIKKRLSKIIGGIFLLFYIGFIAVVIAQSNGYL